MKQKIKTWNMMKNRYFLYCAAAIRQALSHFEASNIIRFSCFVHISHRSLFRKCLKHLTQLIRIKFSVVPRCALRNEINERRMPLKKKRRKKYERNISCFHLKKKITFDCGEWMWHGSFYRILCFNQFFRL